ncbi:glycosyl transferase family 2 [Methanobacterium lacus]|uniref:Glycosyl transferase family 2 n=1 Tax=Methanobacterium lacus (strain AL-21) TaxID=877455 RepID=F0TAV1_METLA|nr:glycosyltransferase family 2 protein [Methanobacterium lacus]ADZ08977.1 glycosyl transferase family 2 [Methanobacterium lacus]
MNSPRVAIVILNWNGWKDTIECLESVFQINYRNYTVVLVDNNSTDDSVQKIVEYAQGKINVESDFFDYSSLNKPIDYQILNKNGNVDKNPNKQLTLIINHKNDGFAEGNNIGMKYALENLESKYVLLLNNDTVVDKYFLDSLVKEGENNKKIGFLGSKIYYYDKPETIWCVGGKIDWKFARGLHIGNQEHDHGQYQIKNHFDYISGAALLIKKELLEDVGLLDEKYFLYFEETDLELRAALKGYENIYIPKSKIWHKVSRSGGGISNEVGLYYITRNRWIFMKKWAKPGDFLIFIILQIFMAITLPILLSIYHTNKNLFITYYRGLFDGIF